MVKAKVWTMAKRFEGEPRLSDFKMIEEELPALNAGDFVVQAEWTSVDPYNRAWANMLPENSPMIGFQVGKVIESKSSKFAVGNEVVGQFGWRTHTVCNENDPGNRYVPYVFPPFKVPLSTAVGVLGMPGLTAYFGLLDLCQPKPGETVLVNAAAGAVGSAVGQIAKIKGCRVIGYAGSDDKVAWLKSIGFDHAYNYKKTDLEDTLKEAAPQGIDCFFDNVGGTASVTIFQHMNQFGRVCICGSITEYNRLKPSLVPTPFSTINHKQLIIKGLLVFSYYSRAQEGISQMEKWIEEGKLKYEESKYDGFHQMPQALIDQLSGKRTGKLVVKV